MLIFLLGTSLSAQTRMWTDAQGKRFEGTFEKELFGDLLIRGSDGQKHFLSIDKLSPADLKYVQLNAPPEMEMDVRYTTRILPKVNFSRDNDNTTMYTFTVRIAKTGVLPYKGELTAELFIIADEMAKEYDDDHVLMSYTKKNFVFPDGKESAYEFTVGEIPFNVYLAEWIETGERATRGKTYLGYILIVTDSKGRVVAHKENIKDLPWLTEDMSITDRELRRLYNENRGSIESRHFNDTFGKIPPPRIPWFRRTVTQ